MQRDEVWESCSNVQSQCPIECTEFNYAVHCILDDIHKNILWLIGWNKCLPYYYQSLFIKISTLLSYRFKEICIVTILFWNWWSGNTDETSLDNIFCTALFHPTLIRGKVQNSNLLYFCVGFFLHSSDQKHRRLSHAVESQF